MIRSNFQLEPRAEELLVDQALFAISTAEQAELDALLQDNAGRLQDEFMHTAALLQLGMLELDDQLPQKMPAHLRHKILADASRANDKVVAIETAHPTTGKNRVRPSNSAMGWAVAAALAVALVLIRTDFATDSMVNRATLLMTANDLVTLPWAQPEIPAYAQVRGDVVWSDASQSGYLRLTGMPANNPQRQQYQLWIVDPERSAQPVDGGVFDIPAGSGEVIIPINAKLAVARPAAFAITLEKPGGVVVSAGPLLVIASAATAG